MTPHQQLRAERGRVCGCRCACTCPFDEDLLRVVDAGMPLDQAFDLARARFEWRRMQEEGDPHVPGRPHYLLAAVQPGQRDVLSGIYWGSAEAASAHPLARTFDALWVRQFRRTRGLRPL